MAGLKIVFKRGAPKGDDGAEDSEGYEGGGADDDGDDVTAQAKSEALKKLAAALGVKVQDEAAALEALEELVYHCSEG